MGLLQVCFWLMFGGALLRDPVQGEMDGSRGVGRVLPV